jgi:hypothetical protein
MSAVAANGDYLARRPDGADVPASMISTARAACALLACADIGFVAWMVAAGRQWLWPAVYALCLALLVIVAVLFGFLAAHAKARRRPIAFANVALAAAWSQAAVLGMLLAHGWSAGAHGAMGPRAALLALTLVAVGAFSLIRNRAATHLFLTQLAHRAISLGVWLLVARFVVALWSRPLDLTAHLLPAAFGLFAVAALASLAALYTSRNRGAVSAEARGLSIASASFTLGTLALLVVGRLLC